MHAVFAGDGVGGTVSVPRVEACIQHRPEHIRKPDILRRGDLDADVAQRAQVKVFGFDSRVVPAALILLAPPTGRTLDHARASRLARLYDRGGFLPVELADRFLVWSVLMIIHPIASRRNGRLEAQTVVRHPRQEAGRSLAAPTVLAHGDVEGRHA